MLSGYIPQGLLGMFKLPQVLVGMDSLLQRVVGMVRLKHRVVGTTKWLDYHLSDLFVLIHTRSCTKISKLELRLCISC